MGKIGVCGREHGRSRKRERTGKSVVTRSEGKVMMRAYPALFMKLLARRLRARGRSLMKRKKRLQVQEDDKNKEGD